MELQQQTSYLINVIMAKVQSEGHQIGGVNVSPPPAKCWSMYIFSQSWHNKDKHCIHE